MDTKITALPDAVAANEGDIYPIVQAATTRKQTLTKLRQAIGANIVALFGLAGANNKLAFFTGAGAMALTDFSPQARLLLDDLDAASMRTTLGVQNVSPGYIEGLTLQWNSANAITVTNGAAYLNGAMVQVPTAIATTGMVLSAATWYHCYLYLNAGVPAVEFVTTAPTAPYWGTARNKTGDTTRRYIGSVRTAAANTIIRFIQGDNIVSYLADTTSAPFTLVNNGQATTSTVVPTAAAAPITATHISIALTTTVTGTAVLCVGNPDMGNVSVTNAIITTGASTTTALDLVLSQITAQSFNYIFTASPGSGGFYARAYGYKFQR